MSFSSGPAAPRTGLRDFLASVWLTALPTDSEHQRRRKTAARTAQLAVALLVLAPLAATLVSDWERFSAARAAVLALAGLACIGWSAMGTRYAIRRLLWEQGPEPEPPVFWRTGARGPAAVYFAVQLALAGLIYHMGGQGRASAMAWLALLPPVGHAVILLSRTGIVVVSLLAMGILACDVAWWYSWEVVSTALFSFSFAVLFTLVFTVLAASSEKARGKVQQLACELGEANRLLRANAAQAAELAATRERNRLAREIHDSLGHYLTVVNMQLEAARAVQLSDPARARDALDKAQSLTREGLQEIRRSVSALRASPLEDKSVAAALEQLAAESRDAGLDVQWLLLGEPRPASPQAGLTLYRAGQEGLTNVRKHAPGSRVQLTLDYRNPACILLSVADTGPGMAGDVRATAGFGLLGLRERAQLLGGQLRVRTQPGAGFALEAEIPA